MRGTRKLFLQELLDPLPSPLPHSWLEYGLPPRAPVFNAWFQIVAGFEEVLETLGEGIPLTNLWGLPEPLGGPWAYAEAGAIRFSDFWTPQTRLDASEELRMEWGPVG